MYFGNFVLALGYPFLVGEGEGEYFTFVAWQEPINFIIEYLSASLSREIFAISIGNLLHRVQGSQ